MIQKLNYVMVYSSKSLDKVKKARFYVEHALTIDPKNEYARSILSALRRSEAKGH
jgi:hypothetical protein